MSAKTKRKTVKVSAKLPKVPAKPSLNDPMAKMIMSHFDAGLKEEFGKFLQEKAKVIPIKGKKKAPAGTLVTNGKGKAGKKARGEYNKEVVEPISFKEVTSHNNPLFSAPGKYNPAEVNPETIDVDTFTLMRRNYQLSIGLAMIKLPIAALPWRIVCDDRNMEKTITWAMKKIWKKLVKTALMAVDYGFASHEKVWERDVVKVSEIDKEGNETVYYQGDLVYFKKIKPHHPESIKMKFDELQNLVEIVQEAAMGSSEIELPIRKVFLFTNDEEYGNPFGVSRLKNAYTVWYYQNLLLQFMMQYFERRGVPPTVATAPPGRSLDSSGGEIDNLEMALRLATSLISSSVAVLPYQVNKEGRENMWKLETFKDDARAPMFIEALVHLEARGLRALFVPEGIIGSDEGGGSGSNSLSADMFLMTEKALIADFENAVTEQLINPFIQANYPPEQQREASIKLDPLSFERKITVKEIFTEMLRNSDTMIQMGVAPAIVPSIEKMAQILEIPIESWEDATGMTAEEFQELFEAQKNPVGENMGEGEGSDPKKPGDKSKPAGEKKTPAKAGKKPRKTSVSQEQNRKRSNPSSKRSSRKRDPLNRTRENG